MKTREWIFVILLVILGQMLLHYLAFDFAKSGRALGYISIAGTIVSIVLGMIAIIYSFVQSISHSNSVADIKSQVEKLVEVGDGISQLETGLQKSAKKINRATKSLYERIRENTDATKRVADNMESIGLAFATETPSTKAGAKKVGGGGYSSQWTILDICHLMLADCLRLNMDLVDLHVEVINPYSEKTNWTAEFISGVFTAISMDLAGRGLLKIVDIKDEAIRLEKLDGLDEYLAGVKEESQTSSSEEISSYLEFIKGIAAK